VTITGVVENNGGATGNAWITFFTILGVDTLEISSAPFTAEPYDSLDVTIPWFVSAPYGRLFATITGSDPPEFNTFNNSTDLEYGARIQLIRPIPDIQIAEDTVGYVVADLDTVFANIDNTQLIYEAESSSDQVSVSVLPGYRLSAEPAPNWFGYSTITVTANNVYSDSNTDSFILFVWPVNDPPVVVAPIPDLTVLQDTFEISLATRLEDHFSDSDAEDYLQFTAQGLADGLDSLTITGITADSTRLQAYPTAGFTGDIPITVTAADDSLAFVSDTLVLTVTSFIFGCTDDSAANYVPGAHIDDGSCQYIIDIPETHGWNWFSLNVETDDMSVNTVLASIEDNGQIIKSQTAYSQYIDPENGWFGSLTALNNTSMFMMKLTAPDTLTITGVRQDGTSTPIPVTENWNWISYLPTMPMDIEMAMATVSGTRATLKSQLTFSQYVPQWGIWFGTLMTLEPYDGFMLNMEISDTLIYPEDAPAVAQLRPNIVVYPGLSRGAVNWQIDPYQFNHSATVTAQIDDPAEWMLYPTAVLGAFVGDECRGVASGILTPGDGGILFPVLVYSNATDGEEIRFRMIDMKSGQSAVAQTRIPFIADQIWGDPLEPLMVSIGDGTGLVPSEFALGQPYPNPFNPTVNIPYSLRDDTRVRIAVYDLRGREIAILEDEFKSSGFYHIRWDAQYYSSGIYLVRMAAGDFTGVVKIAMLK